MENINEITTEALATEEPIIHTYTVIIKAQNTSFILDDMSMNGTNYVSDTKVDTSAWPPTFELTAEDEDGNVTEHISHAKLIQQETYPWDEGKYYLAFAPVSQQEIQNAKIQSQLDYLALMADVDLDA